MTLAIISHTEHYLTTEGQLVGWGSTVTEINHLLEFFDTIYHVAMLHPGPAPQSALPYASDRIVFVALPAVGGPDWTDKLQILRQAPKILRSIRQTLKQVDYFQFRAPTGMGVFVIPYLTLFSSKKGWFKYAGNWQQVHPPLGYRIQRFLLKHQRRKVTVNGFWEGQATHCLTFENPCLTEEELALGADLLKTKSLEGALRFCFVGRLEDAKGVGRIIEAFKGLSSEERTRVAAIDFVGEGQKMTDYQEACEGSGLPFYFHGTLGRAEVHAVYQRSQVLLLPSSASEGFPKVIAEAMNYGCIPLVSNVSAIGHYIHQGREGLVLADVSVPYLLEQLRLLFRLDTQAYQSILAQQRPVVARFTFAHYMQQLKTLVLKHE